MGFRFRKSLKIIPGIRLNLSKSGPSLSLGSKGVIYGDRVEIDVELEEASLKTRVTVLGLLGLIYYGVGNYKAFKDGVAELCNDARTYATDVCGKIVDMAHVTNKQVYRIERRLKTPGKLNRLILKLEKLNAVAPALSNDEIRRQLQGVTRELETIQKDLTTQEVATLDKTLVFKNLPRIQELPTDPDKHPEIPRVAGSRPYAPDLFEEGYKAEDVSPGNRLVYHNRIQVGAGPKLKDGTISVGRSLITR